MGVLCNLPHESGTLDGCSACDIAESPQPIDKTFCYHRIMTITVDEFVQTRVLPQHRDVVALLRSLMRETAPDAQEVISYGIPAWKGKRVLAVISPTRKDITFAFSRGADFEDQYGLLKGVGKVSKHIKIKTVKDISEDALRYYIKQALKLDAQ